MFLATVPRGSDCLGHVTDRPLVLIADDDPALRALLHHALEREGFDTVLAANGREVIARIAEYPIDVLVMDVVMPVLDGLQTLREIRTSHQFRSLPVILVTGSDAESDRLRGLEGGADDYLTKPIALKELGARVRAQVRRHSGPEPSPE
jgi:DNA-binding response OmpR family regulator